MRYFIALLLFSIQQTYAEVKPVDMVYSFGTDNCYETMHKTSNEKEYYGYLSAYIKGYMTMYNQQDTEVEDILDGEHNMGWVDVLKHICKDPGPRRIDNALEAYAKALKLKQSR